MSRISISGVQMATNKQKELLKLLHEPEVRKHVNRIIGDAINEFVPRQSGDLQRSMHATVYGVTWGSGLKYAWYQYMGTVYKKNYPIHAKGNPNQIIGWRSRGAKVDSGEPLGKRGYWHGWVFGYSTPHTGANWTAKYAGHIKFNASNEITRYLKAMCRAKGLKV